ncbi:unnamed protein product [Moneuplotes crassus]|uniref:chitin synthase n=1 Tax=Euplotes crassus TaxID=5936 RepID=A0AAD1UKF7_EUPCR|nr:unnamed protein product [Moneuplotes crassus]
MHHMFCITMYNEPYIQILQSLSGIYRAYFELLETNQEKYEDKISICIVCDGYPIFTKGDEKINNWQRYEKAGIYDHDASSSYWGINREKEGSNRDTHFKYSDAPSLSKLSNDCINNDDGSFGNKDSMISLETKNIAHCYSRSMRFEDFLSGLSVREQQGFKIDDLAIEDFLYGDDEETKIKTRRFCSMPIDVHLVVKHFNRGKIESHLWFFKGFCNTVQPTLATIIDAGTIPLWNSLSRMSIFMELNYNTGACCGEIEVMLNDKHDDGKEVTFFESILQRSQYVEYKLSHYLDKSAESLFGYISVLPGAYSMFRWQCIEGVPLNEFLKGTIISDPSRPYPSCSEGNKFLAEDRIMPLEIISKEEYPFLIRYVPGCKAYTDAPSELKVLIKQRRRWFNGSLFATLYVLCHPLRICRRSGKLRALFYWLFFLYMAINTLAGLLIVGLYYAAYSIFLRSVFSEAECPDLSKTANILENIYLAFIFFTLILSTCVCLEWCDRIFKIIAVFMGVFSVLMSVAVLISVMNLELNYKVYIAVGGVICTYVLPMILNFRRLKFLDFVKGTIFIFFMAPTYINIMTIYAISNIHDVTWGSRGSEDENGTESERDKAQRIDYENFRCNFLIVWLFANIAAGWCVVFFSREDQTEYLFLVVLALGGIIALKIIFSICYEVRFWCKNIKMSKRIRMDKKRYGMNFNTAEPENVETLDIVPFTDTSHQASQTIPFHILPSSPISHPINHDDPKPEEESKGLASSSLSETYLYLNADRSLYRASEKSSDNGFIASSPSINKKHSKPQQLSQSCNKTTRNDSTPVKSPCRPHQSSIDQESPVSSDDGDNYRFTSSPDFYLNQSNLFQHPSSLKPSSQALKEEAAKPTEGIRRNKRKRAKK